MRKKEILVYPVSLGCPKNFVDTEVMAGTMLRDAIYITGDPAAADVYFINTCAFIPDARNEATDNIKEAVAWKKSGGGSGVIVVAGCLNQWDIEGKYRKEFPDVDLWLGIDETPNVAEHIKKLVENKLKEKFIGSKRSTYLYDDKTPRLQLTLPHYAYIKIAEGCDHNCSYCSIPRIRGKLRSRDAASIISEAESFVSNGVKELIIIAQDTTFYGDDIDDPNVNLTNLVKSIAEIDGDFWIRIMYTHPASFPDELIRLYRECPKLLPYLDMPLQHITDNILDSMGRKISSEATVDLLKKIRREVPGVCVRTTFIIGYPGETEEDFEQLYEFCREYRFDRMGAFTYQSEPYTRAASLPDKVDAETAEKRRDRLMALQKEISLEKNRSLVGRTFDVLIDSVTENGVGIGRSYMDAPEIDSLIYVTGVDDLEPGDLVSAEVVNFSEYDLQAEFISLIS